MAFIPDQDGLFNSLETGKPFEHCASCRLPLYERSDSEGDLGIVWKDVEPYLVAKSFHKGECVFEYALCEGCRSNMSKDLSHASVKHMKEFFERKMDIEKRSQQLSGQTDPEAWLAKCATCDGERATSESYSIAALFHAGSLMLGPYPACFCGKCEEEIQEGLSKETLGIWDDFIETNFDSPPANVRDLPVTGRPIFF